MEYILIMLLIPSVYFSARFFLLSKNIKEVTYDFNEICENIEINSKLKLIYPDKNFEKLLIEINKYLSKSQIRKITYVKREEANKKEIENISHDLRTPLTSICGYIELINDNTTTEEERKEYISVIERRAKGLEHLIQTFYDLSRLEANEYKLNIEIVDINKELREQLLIFYNDFESKQLSIDVNLVEYPAYAYVDRNAIERIFTNLIQNAINYSKSNFKIISEKKDREVTLIFANDVDNLDKEEVELLFNRFYMNDISRNNQSSGLGLTITKLLIESMGGNIEAQVREGWIIFKVKFSVKESI